MTRRGMGGRLSGHATGCGIVEALQRRRPVVDASLSLAAGATRRYPLAPIFQKLDNCCQPISTMPLISSFFGLRIYLYWLDTRQHNLPHIHANYAGDEAIFGIESGELIDGQLPRRQVRLVEAWMELRREQLMADWRLAVAGQPVFPIEPLN